MKRASEGRLEFDPRSYWERRLRDQPDIRGTGYLRYPVAYNDVMYEVAADRLRAALDWAHIDLSGKQVLDVGAGLGYFVERYLAWGAKRVMGIDITKVSVETLTRRYPEHTFMQADVSSGDLALPGNFDLVSAISVVFHIIEERKFQQAVQNMCAQVQPGGFLIISDWFGEFRLPTARHARPRGLSAYVPLLRQCGVRILGVRPMYYLMGRSLIPGVGSSLFGWGPMLRKLLSLEYRLGENSSARFCWMKYLVATRQE